MTGQKGNHIVEYEGIRAFKASHPDIQKIKRKEETPAIHGNKVWRSSFVLMDFLRRWPPGEDMVIVDIGCGWGVLSSFMARHFTPAEVIGVDADDAVEPYFRYHAKENQVEMRFRPGTLDSLQKKDLEPVDVIVGSDICFWDSLRKEWEELIERAVEVRVGQIYIADPGRSPFWDLAEVCKEKYNAEVYSHEIKSPYKSENYIIEIIL